MTKCKYIGNTETGFQSPPKQTASVGPSPVSWTRHSLTLNTKLQLQQTIRTALVQDIRHDKELCLHSKRIKNYFKINQSN